MWLLRALAVVLALLPLLAGAETAETPAQRLDRWDSEARAIERALDDRPPLESEMAGFIAQVARQLEQIPPFRAEIGAQLKPLRDQLAALGEPPEDGATEPPQIALERRRLAVAIGVLEAFEKRSDQAGARAKGLETRLAQIRRVRFTERLLTQGPSLFERRMSGIALEAILRTANVMFLETRVRIEALTLDAPTLARLLLPFLLLAGSMVLILRVKDPALAWLLAQMTDDIALSRRVSIGLGLTLVRLLLPAVALAMVLGSLRLSGLLGGQGALFVEGLAIASAVVIGAYGLGAAYFSPQASLLRLSSLGDAEARAAHRWLILLAGVVGLDRALVIQGEVMGLAVEGLAALNAVLLVPGGIVLWQFVRLIRAPKRAAGPTGDGAEEDEAARAAREGSNTLRGIVRGLRLLSMVAAVLAPLLAMLGYFAASRFAFYPLVYSGAVIGLCVLLFHVAHTVVERISTNQGARDASLDRLQLIPILVGFGLGLAALPVLALIWGVAPSDLAAVWRQILQGFRIGEVVIAPIDFFWFLAVIVVGFLVTGRFKRLLRNSVLPLTGLDAGGRDAIAAGAGYIGIVATVLIAVSTAGADLSNLAIVAGALSVGIGFGLQNIVNNFVSGVILLIERPIKAGDWIQLPSGSGYVKTINVRSTEVQTFDRSTLFVPNSQLISENVINWTHTDLTGRIIVAVGVDYASDPRKVERILLEIARGHPLMLRRPAPFVLFRGFGADALDFEIRGILRDVNWLLNVQSDIHFEIVRRFREEGITIPFRQHDIAIRNPDALGRAIGAAVAGIGGTAGSGPRETREDGR